MISSTFFDVDMLDYSCFPQDFGGMNEACSGIEYNLQDGEENCTDVGQYYEYTNSGLEDQDYTGWDE